MRGLPLRTPLRTLTEDFVYRPARQRDNEQVSVGSGVNICGDAEARAEEQAFAFCNLELRQIIRYAVRQSRILDCDLTTITGELKSEEVAAQQERSRCPYNQVTFILPTQRLAVDEPDARRRDFEFPTEFRVAVMRHGPAIRNDDLAANFASWMRGRVEIGIRSALAHSLDEIGYCVRETRPRDHI